MQSRRFASLLMVCALVALTAGLFSSRPDTASADHVAAISAGGLHSCVLTTAGGVQCWGRNIDGQLGNGSTTDSATPVDVVGLESGVIAIAMGAVYGCAVTQAGGVQCWGNNSSGQLGGESTETCVEVCSTTPVDVVGLDSSVIAVAAGFGHTCALTASGNVKCWGMNRYGQLGDGTTTESDVPVDVVEEPGGAPLSGVAAITIGGGFHTCALTTDGGVKCWGLNNVGQLGDGEGGFTPQGPFASLTPVDVVGLQSGESAIAAGESHTCALSISGGVKCWGLNSVGEVGVGDPGYSWYVAPVDVVGLDSGVSQVDAGGAHTCALMASGGLKCWGNNFLGAVGDGTSGPGTNRSTPVDAVFLTNNAVAVSTGGLHTCAIVDTGAVTCWGNNWYGQIGDSDGDGCTDFVEHGSDPLAGGLRDHESHWDFADQYTSSPAAKDGSISVGDIGAVVARFGGQRASVPTEQEALAEALIAPPSTSGYHPSADRGPGLSGPNAWDLLPPDGIISVGDIGAVVAQFGHSCA